jgi:hypothetical protein
MIIWDHNREKSIPISLNTLCGEILMWTGNSLVWRNGAEFLEALNNQPSQMGIQTIKPDPSISIFQSDKVNLQKLTKRL